MSLIVKVFTDASRELRPVEDYLRVIPAWNGSVTGIAHAAHIEVDNGPYDLSSCRGMIHMLNLHEFSSENVWMIFDFAGMNPDLVKPGALTQATTQAEDIFTMPAWVQLFVQEVSLSDQEGIRLKHWWGPELEDGTRVVLLEFEGGAPAYRKAMTEFERKKLKAV